MRVRISRVGNSKGIRLPKELLELYRLSEGDELEVEELQDGIKLSVQSVRPGKLDWKDAYAEMQSEAAEADEWDAWDTAVADGIDD